MKTVSSIIPAIRGGESLSRLINSLLDFQVFDTIVLVDNSTDGHIFHDNEYKHTSIVQLHELRSGASYARNAGLQEINSDYVYFLDEDITLGDHFRDSLQDFLERREYFDVVGGRVLTLHDQMINIPKKYRYILGEKDLGTREVEATGTYFGGCNLLIKTELIKSVGGFPVEFGHNQGSMGLNEDVYIQELITQRGGKTYYSPGLLVFHPWVGNREDIIQRIELQGKFDKMLDKKINKKRFFLRMFKYILYIIYFNLLNRYTTSDPKEFNENNLDYIRYKNYVFSQGI